MWGKDVSIETAPRIGLYFVSVRRVSYLIARTLALGGCRVWVQSEIPLAELQARPSPGPAEREYYSWLFSDERIEIVEGSSEAPGVDGLMYEIGHDAPRYPERLRHWISKAHCVVGWNTNDQEQKWCQSLRAELASTARFARFLPSTHRLIVSSGRTALRPPMLLSLARRQGYFVHPKFLHEPALRAEMFADDWSAETPRPVRLFFSGNPEPDSRRRLVEELKEFLLTVPAIRFLDHYEQIQMPSALNASDRLVLWMVRAEPHDPLWYMRSDVVPPALWPRVLQMSDFALCPPAHERKTHRVVESLLQGVIPILDCPEEYDIGLRDGVNCLAVRYGQWKKAFQRALEMRAEEVIQLRRAVRGLALAELHPHGAARRWLQRLGVES